ncbi:MAG TPA: hypothetical protein ENJ09_10965 [Planctomycetes bacterium]|nr:hypothetical protein [Planctomycetota bacterium]
MPHERSLPPARPASTARALLHASAFTVVFLAASVLVGRALRQIPGATGDPTRRAVMLDRAFDRVRDEVDLVFLGSSRFYRGVNPRIFDKRVRNRGGEELAGLRSFNLSLNGMGMVESIERVRELLESNPARLRWIVLELTDLDPVYLERNRMGPRMVAWHSARATIDALRVVWSTDRSLRSKFEESLAHLAEFGTRMSGRGAGPRAVLRLAGIESPFIDAPNFNGYETREQQLAWGKAWKTAAGAGATRGAGDPDEEEAERHRREVEERRASAPKDLPPAHAAVLGELVELCRTRGVEPIFVLAPVSGPNRLARIAQRAGVLPTLFAYNVPREHPELFQRALFRDESHYNDDGARVFSRALADDFLAWLGER